MVELVKPWNDDSGDTFAIIYNHKTQKVTFSSMPNSGEQRESIVKLHSIDGKDSFGILVRQGSANTNWKSQARPLGFGVTGSVGFGHFEGVDLRCVVFLNKEGDDCIVNLISVEDEQFS